MEEQKVMEEGFERYLVVSIRSGAMIVSASSYLDALAELKESGIDEEDVIVIVKIDLVETEETEEEEEEEA